MPSSNQGGNGRVPPHNYTAEKGLLGAMLISATAIETARTYQITAETFYKVTHGHIFEAIDRLYQPGDNPYVTGADAVTVADDLRRSGLLDDCGGMPYLLDLQGSTTAPSNAPHYAKILSDLAVLRGLIGGAGEIAEMSYDEPKDIDVALDRVDEIVTAVKDRKAVIVPEGLTTLDGLLAIADELGDDFAPWLIPGVVKKTSRIVVVSKSGVGKSTLMQMLWICAAAGLHPFTLEYLDNGIRVLFVDLENPRERIVDDWCRSMHAEAVRLVGDNEWFPERCALWPRQRPLDVTEPRGRAELESAIRCTQPDLVIIAPLYRLATMDGPQGLQTAAKVMAVLDDLRTRYEFGLIIESHAPSTNGGDPLRVRGSEQWNYWPEVSIALTEIEGDLDAPVDQPVPRTFETRRTRGDRIKHHGWPARLRHSRGRVDGPWPWVVVESEDPNAF